MGLPSQRLGALGTDTVLILASPKWASWLYFVHCEGEGELHRSSSPGVSQDEGVQVERPCVGQVWEVCLVRRPQGCGPRGSCLGALVPSRGRKEKRKPKREGEVMGSTVGESPQVTQCDFGVI